jgi:hypothetical protein
MEDAVFVDAINDTVQDVIDQHAPLPAGPQLHPDDISPWVSFPDGDEGLDEALKFKFDVRRYNLLPHIK